MDGMYSVMKTSDTCVSEYKIDMSDSKIIFYYLINLPQGIAIYIVIADSIISYAAV